MTREEIVRLAFQAGMTWQGGFTRVIECVTETELERFAHLVADYERRACAKVADSMDPLQDGAIGKAIRSRGIS